MTIKLADTLQATISDTTAANFAAKITAAIQSLPENLRSEVLSSLNASSSASTAPIGAGPLRPLLTPLQASRAHENNRALLRTAKMHAARLGFDLDCDSDKKIDTFALDKAIAGKDPLRRMELKEMLSQLHLIP